jgi:hypothetical protein
LLTQELLNAGPEGAGVAAEVGRDEGAGRTPEGMIGRKGFGVGDVESGHDATSREGCDEVGSIHHGASRDVDEQGVIFEKREESRIHHAAGFIGEKNSENDHVGQWEQLFQVGDGFYGPKAIDARRARYPRDVDLEGQETTHDFGADTAGSENEHALVC